MTTEAMRFTARNPGGSTVTGTVFHAITRTGTAGATVRSDARNPGMTRIVTMTGPTDMVPAAVTQDVGTYVKAGATMTGPAVVALNPETVMPDSNAPDAVYHGEAFVRAAAGMGQD